MADLTLPPIDAPAPASERRCGPEEIKTGIEIAEKAALGALALGYTLGLFVVSFHLHRFGVSSPTGLQAILRLTYLLAGVWALVPLCVVCLVTAAAVGSVRLVREAVHRRREHLGLPVRAALMIGFPTLMTGAVVWVLEGVRGIGNALLGLGIARNDWLALLPFSALFVASAYGAVHAWLDRRSRGSIDFFLLTSLVSAFAGIVYAYAFSAFAYPTLPSHLGGGAARPVRLLLSGEKNGLAVRLKSVGVPLEDATGGGRTGPVYLLFSTDTEYGVLCGTAEKPVTIVLRRDEVDAVLHPVPPLQLPKGAGRKVR